MGFKKAPGCLVSTIAESALCPAPPSFLHSCGEADRAGSSHQMLISTCRHTVSAFLSPGLDRTGHTCTGAVYVFAKRTTFDRIFEYLSTSIVAQSAKTYFETRSESCAGYMYFYAFLSFRWLIYICMCASSLEDLLRHGLHDLLRETLPQDKES